jgi:PAS domain S-box-containing protein
MFLPQSIYGVMLASPWRTVEHVWWVIFEDIFLFHAGQHSLAAMIDTANKQAELESTRVRIEELVSLRTAELRVSEARYQILCDTAPLGIFQATPQAECLYINARFAEIFGLSLTQAKGKGWNQSVAEEDVPAVAKAWFAAVNGDGNYDATYRVRAANTRWVHALATRIVDPHHGGESYVGTVEDITEQVMAQQQRRERELIHERMAQIVQHANDPIIRKNADGIVLNWNAAATRFFGYTAEEMLGKTIKVLLPEALVEEDNEMLRRVLSGEIIENFETVRLRKGNIPVDVSITYSLMRDAGDKLDGVSVFYRDISPRKEVEKRLSEFYSTISHELRTPLTSIRGALGLIDDEIIEMGSDECNEMIKVARSSSERLVRLINDILDIKKIEAGKLDLRLQKIESSTLVTRAVQDMDGLARASDITLLQDIDTEVMVEVDIDRITQVLTNLISNAIKFSSPGNSVNIGLSCGPEGNVRFTVTDEGSGVPLDLQPMLFQPFQQIDSSDTRSKEGTGLGLALCKAIVEEHHGRIGMHSSEVTGSTFWFELSAAEKLVSTPTADKIRSRILLVEDDENLAQFLRLIMRKAGYSIMRAATVAEAVKLIDQSIPKLILLDLMLPDGSGLEVLKHLKTNHPGADVPVIVTTGRNLDELALSTPVVFDCFFKPLNIDALLIAVGKHVEKSTAKRILLVEDDDAARSVIAAQLRAIGVNCLEVTNGVEAIEMIEDFHPDMIVLDICLPKLNGFEVISALQQGAFATIPLLVYTGQELSEQDRHRLSLGLTRYLNKGRVSPQEFVSNVQGILSQLNRAGDKLADYID